LRTVESPVRQTHRLMRRHPVTVLSSSAATHPDVAAIASLAPCVLHRIA
jgi:hypothetical protein